MNKSIRRPHPIIIHLPDQRLRHPLQLWRRLIAELIVSRHLVREMLRRDLISQYRQSILGLFLTLLPVLATTAWAILFREARIINVGDVEMPYPFYVLLGLMVWAGFTEGIDAPMSGLLAEQGLISKSGIAPEVVTLARLGQVFVNFFMKTLVVALAAAFYRIPPSVTVVFAPLAFLLVVTFGTAIGLILAPINVLYHDVSKALPIVTTFWFFVTPIIFTLPDEGAAALIMQLNPVTPLLVTIRDLSFRGTVSMPIEFMLATALTLVFLLIGVTFHRVAMPIVIDRTNS